MLVVVVTRIIELASKPFYFRSVLLQHNIIVALSSTVQHRMSFIKFSISTEAQNLNPSVEISDLKGRHPSLVCSRCNAISKFFSASVLTQSQ